jgi:hypothetical protein
VIVPVDSLPSRVSTVPVIAARRVEIRLDRFVRCELRAE